MIVTAAKVKTWYRVHKWTSLICTLFLLMACVTGFPLIFHDELGPLLNHEVRPAEMPAGSPSASIDRMVEQAKRRMPEMMPYSVFLDDDEPRVLVYFTPTPKPKKFQRVVFDAHTGQPLEQGPLGKDLLSRLLLLHSALFLELPGELLMGLMALLFVISLVSGALVYGPFMRRLSFGTYRTQPARLRWFDLHNLLGMTALAWMLVVGTTGVMNALSTPLFGLWRAQVMPKLLASYAGKPPVGHLGSVDDAFTETARLLPNRQVTSLLFPNAIIASPRHYVIWTKGTSPVTSRLFTPVLIDVENGKATVADGLPWYLRTLEVCRPLHFGDYGGLPLKVIWALFDLIAIVVLGSGVYLWLSRKSGVERWLENVSQSELREEVSL